MKYIIIKIRQHTNTHAHTHMQTHMDVHIYIPIHAKYMYDPLKQQTLLERNTNLSMF